MLTNRRRRSARDAVRRSARPDETSRAVRTHRCGVLGRRAHIARHAGGASRPRVRGGQPKLRVHGPLGRLDMRHRASGDASAFARPGLRSRIVRRALRARGLCGDGRRSLAALARPCAALRERAGARHRLPVPELPRARPGRLLRHRRHDLLRLRRALVRRAPRRAASRSRAVAAGRRARARRVLAAQARGLRGAHDVGGASRRRVLERGPALRGAAMPPLLRMRVA